MTSHAAIMLCTGQRLADTDHAGHAWSPALEEALRRTIADELDRHGATVGYSCGFAGPDIVFAEEILSRDGELHLFLPCPLDSFVEEYLGSAGKEWIPRFQRISERATLNVSSEEKLPGDETLLRFNNQMLQGLARIHADRIGTKARLLVVWSPEAPAEPGSPADFMDQWPEIEHLSAIDLDSLRESAGLEGGYAFGASGGGADAMSIGTSPLVVRAIFFADIATYTSIRDDQVPALWDFLAEVQQVVEATTQPPILINTWGDAIHAVAENALDLASYATTLVDTIAATPVENFGLTTRPRFRVALHAGPVYVGLHPLTGRSMIYGHHVNRAARIEGVGSPGEAYASLQFVALLRSEMDALEHHARLTGGSFRPPYQLDYVGTLELPKNFGREAIYRITANR